MKNKKLILFLFSSMFFMSLIIVPSLQISGPLDYNNTYPINYYDIDYTLSFNVTFQNGGVVPVTNLDIWLGSINNWSLGQNQLISIQESTVLSINPAPDSIFTDDNNPNNTILFYSTNIAPGDSYSILIEYNITGKDALWLINPASIGTYNLSSELYLNYTIPENFIESNDTQIIQLASDIVTGLTNPYLKAKAIYDWVTANLQYEIQTMERGAVWALNNLRGDCSEFSDLFIALCRATGIPARKVTGWAFSDLIYSPSIGNYTFQDYPGHAWTEIYLENFGWITVDPTWGNSGYYYFGKIDPFHLITVKGQNVTVPNNSFTEFSSLHYEWLGSEQLTDQITIELNIINISTPVSIYSLEIFLEIILATGIILVLIGVISKKTMKGI